MQRAGAWGAAGPTFVPGPGPPTLTTASMRHPSAPLQRLATMAGDMTGPRVYPGDLLDFTGLEVDKSGSQVAAAARRGYCLQL